MTTAILVAMIVTSGFAACGPHLARTLAPATAVRLLVPTMLVIAGCGAFVLAVVAFTGAGQIGEVAEVGRWSPAAVHQLSPVSDTAAAIAGLLLVPAVGWACVYLARTVRAIRATVRACHGLPSASDPVLIIDSDRADAFTTPGLSGRIVVTTALLDALNEPQRRALLAHERSHLQHRHPWWTITADLSAAINPLLRPTAQAIRQACERWADEDAAAATSRRLVAATITHAALLVTRQHPTPAHGATSGAIPARVQALLRPPPRTRPLPVALIPILATAMIISAVVVQHTTEALFETAEHSAIATTAQV